MADVVIVYPKTGFDIKKTTVDMPLGTLGVASVLVDQYKVKIIDQRVQQDWEAKLRKALKTDPIAVMTSSMTGTQIEYALGISKLTKEHSNATMIWGGLHPSLLPEQTVSHPLVDVAVVGDAESLAKPLVEKLEQKGDLTGFAGISFKKGGKVVHNPPAAFAKVEYYPPWPFELLEDIEGNYIGNRTMTVPEMKRTLAFITSRGCPYRCSFCCVPATSKRVWRAMSVDLVEQRVMEMVNKFKLDGIVFHDENFLSNPKRAEELADRFAGKFLWSIQARMDNIGATNLEKLEKGGLRHVQPGVESGSARILKLINKDETKQQIIDANRKLAKTKIVPAYNFMMGFPTETDAELFETIDLALLMLRENPHAQVAGFYTFMPTPGTELFKFATDHGFTVPDTLEGWIIYSRQHQDTPWILDKLEMLNNITLTSKLVDGSRVANMFQKFGIPQPVYGLVGKYYRRRWAKRNFRNTLDIRALSALSKILFKY